MKLTTTCPICGKQNIINIDEDGYYNWLGGELIQNALPNLTYIERELLITGTCQDCIENNFENYEVDPIEEEKEPAVFCEKPFENFDEENYYFF